MLIVIIIRKAERRRRTNNKGNSLLRSYSITADDYAPSISKLTRARKKNYVLLYIQKQRVIGEL